MSPSLTAHEGDVPKASSPAPDLHVADAQTFVMCTQVPVQGHHCLGGDETALAWLPSNVDRFFPRGHTWLLRQLF